MPQQACFAEYFPDSGSLIGSGSFSLIDMSKPHAGLWWILDNGRPFVPFVGVIPHPTLANVYIPDTIANNINFRNAFVEIPEMAFTASTNFVQDVAGFPTITSEYFKGYLYKKLFDKQAFINRFYGLYQMVEQFWATANAAWSPEQYYNALTQLINKIGQQADKALYLPNGFYQFGALSPAFATLDLWRAAEPNFQGMFGVELYI